MPSQRPGVDETGNAACPMVHVTWEYNSGDDSNSERLEPTTSVCGAEIYLSWSFSVPVGPGDHVENVEVPLASVASHWQVECTMGHVLAIADRSQGCGDDAEPFDYTVLFGG